MPRTYRKVKAGTGPASRPVTKATVKRIVKAELHDAIEDKYIDTVNTSVQPVAPAGALVPLVYPTQIPGGSGRSQRVGRKVNLQSMTYRYQWYPNTGVVTPTNALYRIIVAQWQGDGSIANPRLDQVLEYPNNVLSLYAKDSIGQFKIILDKTHDISNSNVGSENTRNWNYPARKVQKSLKHLSPVEFSSDVALNGVDHLYMWFLTDAPAPPPETALCNHMLRLNYEDA